MGARGLQLLTTVPSDLISGFVVMTARKVREKALGKVIRNSHAAEILPETGISEGRV